MNRAMQFASQYGAYIDDVIHTGDLVYEKWNDGIAWFSNVENKQNILQVIGNHDVAVKAGSDGKVYIDPNDLSQYIETSGYVLLDKTTHPTLGYKNSDN
jgi:predicted phosphodiesterase